MTTWSPFRASGSLAVAALCLMGTSLAQEPEETVREAVEQDFQENQRRQQQDDAARAIAIPFEQVLAAPEDVQLNIAYARQQIAAGDLKEAGTGA